MAGRHDRGRVLLEQARAGDQRRHLLFLDHLPVDEVLDVGMIGVDDDHLGRTPRGPTRLDGTGRPVADLEEAHQPRAAAAAGQALALATQAGEIGAGAGAVLEQARLADPQVHDPALVDEIVLHALDEAGMGLRPLIGGGGGMDLAGGLVDIEVTLCRAVDAVGPVQAGVEPLRRVRRRHLRGQHVALLVVERTRIVLTGEVAALPTPIGPRTCEAIEYLGGAGLAAVALGLGQVGESGLVGDPAAQPGWDGLLTHRLKPGRYPGLAEILLRQNVDGHLRPAGRRLERVEAEHDGSVRAADFTRRQAEFNRRIGRIRLHE